jgi:hypothetical protein
MVRAMDLPRELARSNGLGRSAIGVALVLAPGVLGKRWVGEDELTDGAKLFARALGARDLALGLGTLLAMKEGGPTRGWLEGAALADVIDAAATLLAWKKLPPAGRSGVLAIAVTSAVQCALVARVIDS